MQKKKKKNAMSRGLEPLIAKYMDTAGERPNLLRHGRYTEIGN